MKLVLPLILLTLSLAPSATAGACVPSTTLTELVGNITDGPGDYLNSQNCYWYIKPAAAADQWGNVVLSFTQMYTEHRYDFVRIYDGPTSDSPQLASLTSRLDPPPTIRGSLMKSPSMTVWFTSDGSQVEAGFTALYRTIIGCGEGHYEMRNSTHLSCIPCPAGTANAVSGAVNASACIPCDRGWVSSSGSGSSTCRPCEPGSWNGPPNATLCTPCPGGTFSNTTGAVNASVCVPCHDGWVSIASSGSTSCKPCPLGSWGDRNHVDCTLCPAGTFGIESGAKNQSVCEQCHVGSVSPEPGVSSCSACPPATFGSMYNHTHCVPCPAGTASNSFNATKCEPCHGGWVSGAKSTTCTPCPAGQYASADNFVCFQCPFNTASAVVAAMNSSVCEPCANGTASTHGSTMCIKCDPGWVPSGSICIPCSTNYYQNGTVCSPCPPGSYSVEQSTSCVVVPGNQVGVGKLATHLGNIVAGDPVGHSDDEFGSCIGVSGDYAIVGSPNVDNMKGVVYVYHYRRSQLGSGWSQSAVLRAADGVAGDAFGASCAISGDTILVGAWRMPTYAAQFKAGKVYVFEFGQKWNQVQILSAGPYEKIDDRFGASLAVADRSVVVVGAPGVTVDGHPNQGMAFVYERQGSQSDGMGVWNSTAELKLHGNSVVGNSLHGISVALSQGTLLVGAPKGYNTGYVSVYSRAPATGSWTFVDGIVLPVDPDSYDSKSRFGETVAISGSVAAISRTRSDYGEVYIVERVPSSSGSGSWRHVVKLRPSGSGADWFGASLAISGTTVVVGAPLHAVKGKCIGCGAAYLVQRHPVSGTWNITAQYMASGSDLRVNAAFGTAVALSIGHGVVWIGGPKCDGGVFRSGAVWQFGCGCGSYVAPGAGICSLCPQYSASLAIGSANASTCLQCPKPISQGTLVSPGLCTCECQAGSYANSNRTKCVDCPIGTASNSTGATDSSTCSACPSGHVASTGSAYCNRCGAGTYAAADQSSCLNCPRGTASHVDGATNSSVCHLCSAGTAAWDGSAKCAGCNVGYVALSDGSAACQACQIGQYWINSTTACGECPLGTYSNAGSDTCVAVPDSERKYPGCLTSKLAVPVEPGDTRVMDHNFGVSTSLSGELAVVGANLDDRNGVGSGSAFGFHYNGTTGSWDPTVTFLPNDGGSVNSGFGSAVAVSGPYVAIGCELDDERGQDSGAVYVYEKDPEGVFRQVQKLHSSDIDSSHSFGCAVGLSDTTMVVGARGANYQGAAYVFVRDRTTGVWTQQAKLEAADLSVFDDFGVSVSISKNIAVIGNTLDDDHGTGSGSAAVFERNVTTGQWIQAAKLTASDAVANTKFGGSVSVTTGSTRQSLGSIVVGAEFTSMEGTKAGVPYQLDNAGAAYAYEKSSSGQWIQAAKLLASDPQAEDKFGRSVSVDGPFIVVASSNSFSVFERKLGGGGVWAWTRVPGVDKISLNGTRFNHMAVSVSGSSILIGIPDTNTARIATCCPGTQTLGVACRACRAGTNSPIIGGPDCINCPTGTDSAAGSTSCADCHAGYYNPMPGHLCVACPAGAYCPTPRTSNAIWCPEGYHNHLPKELRCYQCPRPSRCEGGRNCSRGYDGSLCGVCAKGFFVKGSECWECPDFPVFLILAMVVIFIFAVMFLSLRISPVVVARFKSLITFIQCISLTLAIEIPWPPFVEVIKSFLSSLYMDVDLASPECLLGGGVNWHSRFLLSLGFSGTVPLLIGMGVATVALARWVLKQGPQPRRWPLYNMLTQIQIRFSRLLFIVLSIAYVPLTKNAALAFICVDSPIGIVLREDTSIHCASASHQLIQRVAVAVFVLVSGLLPLSVSFASVFDLIRSRGKMEGYRKMDRREILSALFESYRPTHAYFDGIVLARKGIFVLVTTFIVSTGTSTATTSSSSSVSPPTLQSVLLVVTSIVYLAIVAVIRPFAPVVVPLGVARTRGHRKSRFFIELLNWIEIASASSVLLTTTVALIMSFVPKSGWTVGVNIVVSFIVGVTAVAGVVLSVLLFPFTYKRIFARSVLRPVIVKRKSESHPEAEPESLPESLSLGDPRSLLGSADGRWIIALEQQLQNIIEDEDLARDPDLQTQMMGACQTWLDRLRGRLSMRRDLADLFNPNDFYGDGDGENEARNQRIRQATTDRFGEIELESLKFKRGRKEAMSRSRVSTFGRL